jgi:LacI family transcriptional regulator
MSGKLSDLWVFKHFEPEPASLQALHSWHADGIIADLKVLSTVEQLVALGPPVVNVSPSLSLDLPRVGVDDLAVGRLAAGHLMDQGFTHFGFFGDVLGAHVARRKAGFLETLAQRRWQASVLDVTVCADLQNADPQQQDEVISRWLQALPKPVGILAHNDLRALRLSDLCRAIGLHVPDDVSLVGVDNDELICHLGHPPLSSVALPTEKMGFEAARLLAQLMTGRRPPQAPILLSPIRVAVRQSSDVLAIADREIAQVLRFIRENACRTINVKHILRAIPISRRTMEQRFRAILGRTPLEVIRQTQIDRAKQLLTDTDLPMPAVAQAAGFRTSARLSRVFRQGLDLRPTDYRRRSRIR